MTEKSDSDPIGWVVLHCDKCGAHYVEKGGAPRQHHLHQVQSGTPPTGGHTRIVGVICPHCLFETPYIHAPGKAEAVMEQGIRVICQKCGESISLTGY